MAGLIGAVHVKSVPGQIDANRGSLHGGRSCLDDRGGCRPPLWLFMADQAGASIPLIFPLQHDQGRLSPAALCIFYSCRRNVDKV
ncbi:MAG: hypothetical protein QM772_16410 [Ottowia sp.]|uniref:hypothetical protein n=1 Tax=Ottowia sp. TaxID=1898956 RepID=UPI0039E582AC